MARVMQIQDATAGRTEGYAARFRGQLVINSVEAYEQISAAFQPLNFTALFRRDGDTDIILAVPRIEVHPSRVWINALMFALTVLSTLVTGALLEYTGPINSTADLVQAAFGGIAKGLPFAASIMAILGTHELGHYFAARYHKVEVTLPYFLPLPFPLSPFGTLGAFIQLKSPPTNRRVLLDVGLAGPLAGFIVAIPVLLYGLSISTLTPFPPVGQAVMMEGNSLVYLAAKFLVFGKILPGGGQDVLISSVAWAGWAGLLVTGLNLIPAGQLDGGHILYVLIGRRARRLLPVIIVLSIGLGFLWNGWFLWALLIYFLGRTYAEPLDQITDLDPSRRALAILGLVIFVLVFTPIPLSILGG